VTPPLIGGPELLERAIGYTLGSLQHVAPNSLRCPTPCRAWDLKALLTHMNDSLAALHEAVDSGHVGLDSPSDGHPAVDLVAEFKNRACGLIGAWGGSTRQRVTIADRELTDVIVSSAGAVEIAVHGWDVARTCGVDRAIPRHLAEELFELAQLFVSEDDRPERFGRIVSTRPGAGVGERLVAFLGRVP
jgi:uncharacterized protein (TIGR03086 family)